jgi:hypothetical protein
LAEGAIKIANEDAELGEVTVKEGETLISVEAAVDGEDSSEAEVKANVRANEAAVDAGAEKVGEGVGKTEGKVDVMVASVGAPSHD